MNRRKFLRNVAYSAGLVALSACRLRIEDPLLRIEEGEYRSGAAAKALVIHDKHGPPFIGYGRSPVMAIDPGYRSVAEQHKLEQIGRQKYGGHNWTPAFAVGDKIKVFNCPGNDGVYYVTAVDPKQGVVDVSYQEDDHG